MAKIEQGINLCNGVKLRNKVTIELLLSDEELDQLERYRSNTEKVLELPNGMKYTLDDAILYIVGEVMSGRGKYFDLDSAFKG